MKNIPFFQIGGAYASLVLEEIPKKRVAHIVIQSCDGADFSDLLLESARFVGAVGAERIFACSADGHDLTFREVGLTSAYSHSKLLLSAATSSLPAFAHLDSQALNQDNAPEFLEIYNTAFASVPNCRALNLDEALELRENSEAKLYVKCNYFTSITVVELEDGKATLRAIAARDGTNTGLATLCTLMENLSTRGFDRLYAETETSNVRAMSLYKKLGFVKETTLTDWFEINIE